MSTDDTRPLADDLGLARHDEDPTPAPASATPEERPDRDHRYGAPPVYRRGPAPFGIVLAVLGLAVAVGALVSELADVTVPWSDLGPWAVVAGGLLVVLVGLLGLRANRGSD